MRAAPRLPAALLALAAFLAGCTLTMDLTEPPRRSAVLFVDPAPLAAPGEALTLEVTGGQPPYRWALEAGGSGSGNPTLDAATGAYRAGDVGPALDLVTATDAVGSRASVRVSVGAPLTVTPTSAFVSPGGRVSIVGGGGREPYAASLPVGARGSIEGTQYVAPASLGCDAAPSASFTEIVTFTDAVGRRRLEVPVTVGRGLALSAAAGSAATTPRDSLALVASGGQPPYAFAIVANGSGAPAMDAGLGLYTAGPVGGTVDRISVTDANLQQACLDVQVGPALTAALASADVRPLQATRVVASGGRAPYRFAFAERGNHSRGTVDPITGAYTPGPVAGAVDTIHVFEANQALPPAQVQAQVGARQLPIGRSSWCRAADLDGDGRSDLVTVSEGTIHVASIPDGGAPVTQLVRLPGDFVDRVEVTDVNLDGFPDLVASSTVGLRLFLGQPGGGFQAGPTWPALGRLGLAVGRRDLAGRGAVYLAGDTAACGGAGVVRLDWTGGPGDTGQPVLACVRPGLAPALLAVADLDGDTAVDLVMADAGGTEFLVSHGPAYADLVSVALPAGHVLDGSQDSMRAVHFAGYYPGIERWYHDSVVAFVRTEFIQAAGGLVELYDHQGLRTSQAVDVMVTPQWGVRGFVVVDLASTAFVPGLLDVTDRVLLAWDGHSGIVARLPFPLGPDAPTLERAQDFAIDCLASGDFNGDGLPDLVATGDLVPWSDLRLGEADRSYGTRLHTTIGDLFSPLGVRDLDGDGDDDVVVPAGGAAFEALFTDGRQLAIGPTTQTGTAGRDLAVADFDGDGRADVLVQADAGGFLLAPGLDPASGRFGEPQPLPLDQSRTTLNDHAPLAQLGLLATGDAAASLWTCTAIQFQPNGLVVVRPGELRILEGPPCPGETLVADLEGDGLGTFVSLEPITRRLRLLRPERTGGRFTLPSAWSDGPVIETGAVGLVGTVALGRGREGVVTYEWHLSRGSPVITPTVWDPAPAPAGRLASVLLDYRGGPVLAIWLADLDGDRRTELVVQDDALAYVYRAVPIDAGGPFDPAPAWTFPARPVVPSLLRRAAGPPDLLYSQPGELVRALNDGTGQFPPP